MRSMALIVGIAVLLAAGNIACDRFGGSSAAFEEYKKYAEPVTREEYKARRKLLMQRYGGPQVPHLMTVEYALMSSESEGDGEVRLVVREIMNFEFPDENGKQGRLNRHSVLMKKDEGGSWQVVSVDRYQI